MTENKAPKVKKYFPKENLFGQVVEGVDRKGKILKPVKTEVDYRTIKFKHGYITFVKGQEVTAEQLATIKSGDKDNYQMEFYLDAK